MADDGKVELMISRCTYEPRYDMHAARDKGTQQQISLPMCGGGSGRRRAHEANCLDAMRVLPGWKLPNKRPTRHM